MIVFYCQCTKRRTITKFPELLIRVYVVLVFVLVIAVAATPPPISTLTSTSTSTSTTNAVEETVRKWAPLIWLAPEEKYFPLSVEEFLENVYPAFETENSGKEKYKKILLPKGRSSQHAYLITKQQIEQLLRNGSKSFLNGRNPKNDPPPIYATITHCSPSPYLNSPSSFLPSSSSFHSPSSFPSFSSSSSIYYTYMGLDKNEIPTFSEIDPNYHFHVTYWTFYPFNQGKEICFLGGKLPLPFLSFNNKCLGGKKKTMGNHIGDWEHVSLMFNGKTYPDEMYVATHDSGVYYKYDVLNRIFRYKKQVTLKGIVQRPKFPPILRTINGGQRPVLFAALGSHGLWSAPGEHSYTRVINFTDKTGHGVPWKTWLNINMHHNNLFNSKPPPIWLDFLGRWGNPKSNCFLFKKLGLCEFSDGPPGILTRKQNFQCNNINQLQVNTITNNKEQEEQTRQQNSKSQKPSQEKPANEIKLKLWNYFLKEY